MTLQKRNYNFMTNPLCFGTMCVIDIRTVLLIPQRILNHGVTLSQILCAFERCTSSLFAHFVRFHKGFYVMVQLYRKSFGRAYAAQQHYLHSSVDTPKDFTMWCNCIANPLSFRTMHIIIVCIVHTIPQRILCHSTTLSRIL